jgi:hypothetical protein
MVPFVRQLKFNKFKLRFIVEYQLPICDDANDKECVSGNDYREQVIFLIS